MLSSSNWRSVVTDLILSTQSADHSGEYLDHCRVSDPYKDQIKPWATSDIEADRLWKLSEKLTGQEFPY
jgi:hypothetical protein